MNSNKKIIRRTCNNVKSISEFEIVILRIRKEKNVSSVRTLQYNLRPNFSIEPYFDSLDSVLRVANFSAAHWLKTKSALCLLLKPTIQLGTLKFG